MDIKETDILGEHIHQHWYYRAKAQAMLSYLQDDSIQRILDVGAGSGFFTRYLLEHSAAQSGLCVDPNYAEARIESVLTDKSMYFCQTCQSSDADLVLMMDVIEHVDDDVALIQEYAAKVAKNTRFLITVPAFEFLWSPHDVFLEHKRRYTLPQLTRTVEAAGLHVHRANYFFGAVFPLAASMRLAKRWIAGEKNAASDLTQHHVLVNQILYRACQLELSVFRFNRLAGLSVFCLAHS